MRPLLAGKVVAITGAGRGLGRAYALDMARRGARVVVNDLGCSLTGHGADPSVAQSVVDEIVAAGGTARAFAEDVSDFAAATRLIDSAVETYGQLDVLVNNAGILRDGSIFELQQQDWQAVLGVHLGGSFACSRAAAEVMVEQEQGGAIINTVSLAGLIGNVGQCNYAAAKAGIFGLTRALALELAPLGVRVNAVAPVASTRMTEEAPFVVDAMQPERVAPLVSFLASDLAMAINGRIFGMHGDYLFEHAMTSSAGVRGQAWTPERIAEQLDAISVDFGGGDDAVVTEADPHATRIQQLFAHLAAGFRPKRARRWGGRLLFEIAGSGRYTVSVEHGTCRVDSVRVGRPTSVVRTDGATFWGIATGQVDAQQAFVDGRLQASELADLLRFERAFDLARARAASEAAAREGRS